MNGPHVPSPERGTRFPSECVLDLEAVKSPRFVGHDGLRFDAGPNASYGQPLLALEEQSFRADRQPLEVGRFGLR